MPKQADVTSKEINKKEPSLIVRKLRTGEEYHFINLSRKTALLSAYATQKGYMSNWIKNNYESIDGVTILEGTHHYTIGDFTVAK